MIALSDRLHFPIIVASHDNILFDPCLELKPVTALAAFFSPVPTKSELKKCVANFFKGERGAALQLRSPAGCGGEIYDCKRNTRFD